MLYKFFYKKKKNNNNAKLKFNNTFEIFVKIFESKNPFNF